MADTTRGWTSATVTPLYLRGTAAQAVTSPTVSGGITGPVSRAAAASPMKLSTTSTPAPGASSTYKYANQIAPGDITASTQRFDAAPAKVFGAEDFKTSAPPLSDPSLGSRDYATSTAKNRPTDVAATVSTFQGANVPAFLQSSIAQLNAEQYQKRALQQDLLDRLFKAAEAGDYTAYEAIRAAAIQPGAKAAFGSYIVSPGVQSAQEKGIAETTKKTGAERAALERPGLLLQQLTSAQEERARLGQNPFGMYQGSRQQQLDKQIMDLERQLRSDSATVQIAKAAAQPSTLRQSAWVSPMNPLATLPTY